MNRRLGFVRRPAHIAYVKEVPVERGEDGKLVVGVRVVPHRGNPSYLSIQFNKVSQFWSVGKGIFRGGARLKMEKISSGWGSAVKTNMTG